MENLEPDKVAAYGGYFFPCTNHMVHCNAYTSEGDTCTKPVVSAGLCDLHYAEKNTDARAYAYSQLEFKQRGEYATLNQQLNNLLSTFRTLPIDQKLREVEKAYRWHDAERKRLTKQHSEEKTALSVIL